MLDNVFLFKNKRKLLPSSVEYVMVNVSDTCFFRCQMCSIWKNKLESSRLAKEVYKRFFRDLTKIRGPNTEICFTGGEPLANKDIYLLARAASNSGFATIINTNGWLLNDENIKKLFEARLGSITFSLDGSCPEVHDRIRGMPGSFRRIMVNAKKIKKYFMDKGEKITACFTCVISALNIQDIIGVVNLVQKTPYIDMIWLQAVTSPLGQTDIVDDKVLDKDGLIGDKYWYQHDAYKHLWPADEKQIAELYSELIYLKRSGYKIANNLNHLKMQYYYFKHPSKRMKNTLCMMFKDLYIDTNGGVFHCPVKKECLGNIREDRIDQLWHSYNGLRLRRNIIKCQKACHVLLNCGLTCDERNVEFW